jgi:transposase
MSEARLRLAYEVVRRHSRGESQYGIARALGIDRKTVRRILRDAEQRRQEGDDALIRELGRSRTPRASILDPHREFIATRIKQHPDLRATRLLEDLKERGFTGEYTVVREYLKRVRPKPKKDVAIRVETPPGKQAQADWSPYVLADGSQANAWSSVLAFSRYQYLAFRTDQTQPTIFRCLRATIEAFGGVPEEFVFDSMPGVVDRWELNQPILNLRMLDFAAYYGFVLHIAPRADGAYKGKVERPFRFADDNLFNGRTFHSVDALNAFVSAVWLEKANARTHGTLRERPVDRLVLERPHLKPIPTHPYDTRELAYRLVDDYGEVHFETNKYSVPPAWVGEWVYLRADDHEVVVFDRQANRLAAHERRERRAHQVARDPDHNPRKDRLSADLLLSRFAAFGEEALAFAKRVAAQQRYGRKELGAILALQRDYRADDLAAAMRHAARFLAHDARSVARILQARAQPRTLQDQLADKAKERIRSAMADTPFAQRDLAEYARLLGKVQPSAAHPATEHDGEPTQETQTADRADGGDPSGDGGPPAPDDGRGLSG